MPTNNYRDFLDNLFVRLFGQRALKIKTNHVFRLVLSHESHFRFMLNDQVYHLTVGFNQIKFQYLN